jgi:hypothetical protein
MLADEILALATPRLDEAPATPEGLADLAAMADTVIEETKTAASASALTDFQAAASDAGSALGKQLFEVFEHELAGLAVDREGLAPANRSAAWAERWRHVDPTVRERYLNAARMRRDEIASGLAAAEAMRREQVIAAGGDPEIVGHTFRDEHSHSTLEFVDTQRVIFAVLGMRFGGKYEIVNDDIFVEGPNGSVVFARDGNALSGMGLTLERVEE